MDPHINPATGVKHYAKGLCRNCYMRNTQRKYRALHPEADKARKKEWRIKNREKWLFQHERSRIKNKYGLSMEELNDLKEKQEGKCKICERIMTKVCIDHDHETGKVRGLLCDACNTGLGLFGDNPSLLMDAALYIKTDEISNRKNDMIIQKEVN